MTRMAYTLQGIGHSTRNRTLFSSIINHYLCSVEVICRGWHELGPIDIWRLNESQSARSFLPQIQLLVRKTKGDCSSITASVHVLHNAACAVNHITQLYILYFGRYIIRKAHLAVAYRVHPVNIRLFVAHISRHGVAFSEGCCLWSA